MIWQTSQLTSLFAVSRRDSGPKLFPYLTCTALILCAVGKFITDGKNKSAKPFLTKKGWINVILMFAAASGYLLSLTYLGFLVSTPLFSILFVYVMKGDRRVNPLWAVVFAIILTGALYFLFQNFMHVRLPGGTFWLLF